MASTKTLKVSASTATAIVNDAGLYASQAIARASKVKLVIDGLWADGIRFIHIMGDKAKGTEPIDSVRDSIKTSIKAGFPKDVQALMDKPAKDCDGPTRKSPEFRARIDGAETERRQYWNQQPNSVMGYYAKQLSLREGKKKAPTKDLDAKLAKVIIELAAQYHEVEGTIFDILIVQDHLDELKNHIADTVKRIEAEKAQKAAARKARGKAAK